MTVRGDFLCGVILAGALTGCVSAPPEDVGVIDAAVLPVTCYSRPDCSAKWLRARAWLAAHTLRPIVATPVSLRTAPRSAADQSPSFTVSFEARTAGSAAITFSEDCRGLCKPSREQMLGEFNLYLSASAPAPLLPMKAGTPAR